MLLNENTLVVFSILLVPINMVCNHILTILNKTNMLEEPTIIPPVAIITLFLRPLQTKKIREKRLHERWMVEHLDITEKEYDYILSRASSEETEILIHQPMTYRDRRKMIEIRNKYLISYNYGIS